VQIYELAAISASDILRPRYFTGMACRGALPVSRIRHNCFLLCHSCHFDLP